MFSQEKTRYIFLFNDFHRNSSRMQLKLISSEHEKSGSHRFQKSMKQSFHKKKLKLKVEVKEREIKTSIHSAFQFGFQKL